MWPRKNLSLKENDAGSELSGIAFFLRNAIGNLQMSSMNGAGIPSGRIMVAQSKTPMKDAVNGFRFWQEGGWLKWCVPQAFGGRTEKLDVRSLCLIRETLARYDALADFSFAMQGLGSGAVSILGNPEQQQNILNAVSEGRKIAGFALSEPEAGSDVASMKARAIPTQNGWKLNGEKSWISNGGIADFYTLFARTGDQSGTSGISAFLLQADNPGLSIAERQEVMAPHPLARLELNDVFLHQNTLLGEEGKGFATAMATLDIFRPTVGAAALGLPEELLMKHSGTVAPGKCMVSRCRKCLSSEPGSERWT